MKKLVLITSLFAAVSANAQMNIKAVYQSPMCHGDASGSISLVMDGGAGQYSYNWSNGAITPSISNLVAGTYSVTVVDNLGVSAVATIPVAEPQGITINSMVINVTPSDPNSGMINLTPRGGTPDYSYLWSNGATTKDINGLSAGDYTVTLTDGVGCQSSLTATVISQTPLVAQNNHSNNHGLVAPGGVNHNNMATSIYPNPASGSLNLRMQEAGEAEYTLFNANGEVVMKEKFNAIETKADVSNLPAGSYLVQIKNAQGVQNKSVVITK